METDETTGRGGGITADEIAGFFDSPHLYVSDMRWQSGDACCHRMSRESYAESVFLDDRTRSADGLVTTVPIRSIMEAYRATSPAPRPLAIIQHTALCGSTLLCRCLDVPDRCLPYKEPYLLHNLSGIWRVGAKRKLQAQLPCPDTPILDVALAMLGRTYMSSEKPVVKLTDSCVSLCPSILDHHAGTRLLLMYHKLPRFLVAMLRDEERRRFVRNMLVRTHMDLASSGKGSLVTRDFDSDGRAAAYLWLGLMYPYLRLLTAAPERVRSLDAADFFARPGDTVRSVSRFFGLGLSDEQIDTRLADGVLDRDAKNAGKDFNSDRYRQDRTDIGSDLAEEIGDAVEWCTTLSRDDPIPEDMPNAV